LKLNNKGFAISSIMYIILVLAVVLISLTLAILSSRKLILDKLKQDVFENIYNQLPRKYQQVEYIESTGEQYIDTGTILNQDSKVELLISHFDTNGNSKVFGSRTSATENNFSVVKGTSSIVADFHNYENNRLGYVVDSDEFLDISISNEKMKINDAEKIIDTYIDFTTPGTAYLFNGNGTYPDEYVLASMRLYSCKIYNKEKLVRNFIPCYRKKDGVIGMYDLVSGKFYTNVGTGTFIKGSDVE